jgi:uracil-DNA glycosylase
VQIRYFRIIDSPERPFVLSHGSRPTVINRRLGHSVEFWTVNELEGLHQRILTCRACEVAGYIERAAPVVAGHGDNRIMLVGQAPGITELEVRRPFAGRAGKVLFRWLASVDITEREFREHVYVTAITKCYPGRAAGGSGDRRPSGREIALCRPFLEAQLHLVQPRAILLVGGLAIERYFPKRPLTELIGQRFDLGGVATIPLPHPSGASRWLNDTDNRLLLSRALRHVRAEWERWVLDSGATGGQAAVQG